MYREIKKEEAIEAALKGKQTMMVYNLANDDEPEDLVAVRLTERITELTGHDGAIFLVDEPVQKKPDPKPPKGVDVGKIMALTNAGWSAPKIADEMNLSAPTVRKYQKEYS